MSFQTKAEVDRHAEDVFQRCTSDHDKMLKSLNIGKLYYSVKAFDCAIHHFQAFLSVHENSPQAYKFLGKCYQQLGKAQDAITYYERSLELESQQPALVLLICELMNQINIVDIGISSARHWYQKANELFPNNPEICSLRQKIIVAGNRDPKTLENIYLCELMSNPNDENMLINLINLYVDTKQYAKAHKKVVEYQGSRNLRQSLEWHRCLSKLYKFCLKETVPELTDYLMEAVAVYDNYISLLHRTKSDAFYIETSSTLKLFDQLLQKLCSVPDSKTQIDKEIEKHFLAQLAYHISVLGLKKLIQENVSKEEAVKMIGPCLLFAQLSPFNLESPHLSSLDPKYRVKMMYFVDDSIFRIVQSNLTLRNWACSSSEEDIINRISCSFAKEVRARIFSKILTEQVENATPSCWLESNYFDTLPSRFLRVSEVVSESNLFAYERRCASSYHDLVWLGVQLLILKVSETPLLPPIFNCQLFPSRVSSPNLSSVSVETLRKLDIDTFLYLSVFSCYLQLRESEVAWHRHSLADAVPLLPTEKQLEFWAAVQKAHRNEASLSMDMRSILIKGIETVRLIGHHGLDLKLLIHVAKTFEFHARSAVKEDDASHTEALETRAFLFWSSVIRKLEMAQSQHLYESTNVFFPSKFLPITSQASVVRLLEEGRFFIAYKMMRNGDYEAAIDGFRLLSSPDAALNLAMIYKQLAVKEIRVQDNHEITAEMRAKHNKWLTKAKEALSIVEDRLGTNTGHPLRADLEVLAEEIEERLTRYDTYFEDRDELSNLPSPIDSDNEACSTSSPLPKSSFNSTSHNFDLRFKSKEFTNQGASKPREKKYNIKEMIASQTRLNQFLVQLSNRVEKMEEDVRVLARNEKKRDRNIERILAHVRMSFNPVFRPPMANQLFPHLMQQPNFYPGMPDLRFQAMVPPFLAPGMPSFLPPGLPMMPPLAFPQAQPSGPVQIHTIPNVSQLPGIPPVSSQDASLVINRLFAEACPSQSTQMPVQSNSKGDTFNVSQIQAVPFSLVQQPSADKTNDSNSELDLTLLSRNQSPKTGATQHPVSTQAAQVFFKPSALTSAVTPKVAHPSENKSAHLPSMFSPSATSTPPAVRTTRYTTNNGESVSAKTPTSTTQDAPSSHTAQENRNKVSEPLFNLLTTPSSSANPSTTTPVAEISSSFSPSSTLVEPPSFSVKDLSLATPRNRENSTAITPVCTNTVRRSLLKETLLKSVDPSLPIDTSSNSINTFESSPLTDRFSLDFANLANNCDDTSFRKSDSFKGFEGQGSKLFSSPSSAKDSDSPASRDGESAEDFVPDVEFQPLIALPELIEVKTGEEGLTVLYEERCKLLRWDADLKEWKERGIGKMKILHDPIKGTVRLLMRREQVHKVCCNQNLLKDLVLKPVAASDKAWSWSGIDYSDGAELVETFAVRFKNSDLAKSFYTAVEDAKNLIGTKNVDSSSQKPEKLQDKTAPLSELFKPEAGSWECSSCYTRNSQEKSKCLACEAPNPKDQSEPVKTTQKPSLGPSVIQLGANTSSFQFGIPSSTASNTSNKNPNFILQPATNSNGFQFGIPSPVNSAPPKISFGLKATPLSEQKTSINGTDKLSFGFAADSLSKSTFNFINSEKSADLTFGKPIDSSKTQSKSNDSKTVNGVEAAKSFSFNFTNSTSGVLNGGSSSLPVLNGTQQAQPTEATGTTKSEPAAPFAFGPNMRKSLGLALSSSPESSDFDGGAQGASDKTLR